jgi:monofunctional biosynthetic peptidoglycan transglycosylase
MAVRRPHGRSTSNKKRGRAHSAKVIRSSIGRKFLWLIVLVPALVLLLVMPLRWLNPPVTAFMLQQTDSGERSYEWIPLADISQQVWLAVIAAEDQRFLVHNGIDMEAIQKALEEADNGNDARGASTITQQLAKNLYLWPGRSLVRKGIEAGFSLLLDAYLPKQRILELYLNVIEFGPGVYGVGAASQIYFDKSARQLNSYEAALLTAALPNPALLKVSAPSAYMRSRQQWILGQMRHLQSGGLLRKLQAS